MKKALAVLALLVGSLAAIPQTSGHYEVALTWDAPSSSADPVVGYDVYRATGAGAYSLLNSSPVSATNYTDATVQPGTTYTYEVTSVDAAGVESVPSNTYTAAIPGQPGQPENLNGSISYVTTGGSTSAVPARSVTTRSPVVTTRRPAPPQFKAPQ